MDPVISLALANIVFVTSHFAMSHPLRAGMVRALGERGFLGVYSLVSVALFVWIVLAFRAALPGPTQWDGSGDALWIVASLLTILAVVLLVGSMKGNPALPDTAPDVAARAQATGAFAVTRHPMMWGFALWALAHIIVWPSPRTLITAGAMGLLALLGAHLQDRKKQKLLGEAWQGWEARTSYWPRFGKLASIPFSTWLTGLVLWMAFTWLHVWIADMPAGAWRWIG